MARYEMKLHRLSQTQIAMLVGLYLVQPATRPVLEAATGRPIRSTQTPLMRLLAAGLVSREKLKPRNRRQGRLPWIYRLTENGLAVASALALADHQLQKIDMLSATTDPAIP